MPFRSVLLESLKFNAIYKYEYTFLRKVFKYHQNVKSYVGKSDPLRKYLIGSLTGAISSGTACTPDDPYISSVEKFAWSCCTNRLNTYTFASPTCQQLTKIISSFVSNRVLSSTSPDTLSLLTIPTERDRPNLENKTCGELHTSFPKDTKPNQKAHSLHHGRMRNQHSAFHSDILDDCHCSGSVHDILRCYELTIIPSQSAQQSL